MYSLEGGSVYLSHMNFAFHYFMKCLGLHMESILPVCKNSDINKMVIVRESLRCECSFSFEGGWSSYFHSRVVGVHIFSVWKGN